MDGVTESGPCPLSVGHNGPGRGAGSALGGEPIARAAAVVLAEPPGEATGRREPEHGRHLGHRVAPTQQVPLPASARAASTSDEKVCSPRAGGGAGYAGPCPGSVPPDPPSIGRTAASARSSRGPGRWGGVPGGTQRLEELVDERCADGVRGRDRGGELGVYSTMPANSWSNATSGPSTRSWASMPPGPRCGKATLTARQSAPGTRAGCHAARRCRARAPDAGRPFAEVETQPDRGELVLLGQAHPQRLVVAVLVAQQEP